MREPRITLRCLSGPNHGEVAQIEIGQREVKLRQRSAVPARMDFSVSLNAASMVLNETIYTRRVVSTPDGDIEYLAPQGCSNFDALNSVLAP